MPDFEKRIRSASEGLRMTWAELNSFARGVAQTFDCDVEAMEPGDGVAVVARVLALDSTAWEIEVDTAVFPSVLTVFEGLIREGLQGNGRAGR